MAFLTFPRAAKSLIGSKLRATSTGVSLATPWGSHLDFDVSTSEAAELADLFEGLAAAFRARGGAVPAPEVAAETEAPAIEALGSVEAREAFPDVDPHVVALPKIKRAVSKKGRK
jgi:hypothetical protein